MRTVIFGSNADEVKELCREYPFFEFVEKDPQLVIAYGGDGTLLKAEHTYPGTPKFLLKNSLHANKAHRRSNIDILKVVSQDKYDVREYMKLEAYASTVILYAFNDIVIHNVDPRHALRYIIRIDERRYIDEIIGDGVVIATPKFGASGYYRSITDSTFEVGIGLAFNNSHEQRDHVVLDEKRVVEITITRGPAVCYADNQKSYITLEEGESVRIQKSSQIARIVHAHTTN